MRRGERPTGPNQRRELVPQTDPWRGVGPGASRLLRGGCETLCEASRAGLSHDPFIVDSQPSTLNAGGT